MEAKPKSAEVKCLEAAYLALLRMPEGEVRVRNHFLLATVRDSLAAELGREEQEVQSEYEFIVRNAPAAQPSSTPIDAAMCNAIRRKLDQGYPPLNYGESLFLQDLMLRLEQDAADQAARSSPTCNCDAQSGCHLCSKTPANNVGCGTEYSLGYGAYTCGGNLFGKTLMCDQCKAGRPPFCEAEDLAGMIEAQSRGSEK